MELPSAFTHPSSRFAAGGHGLGRTPRPRVVRRPGPHTEEGLGRAPGKDPHALPVRRPRTPCPCGERPHAPSAFITTCVQVHLRGGTEGPGGP